MRRIVRSPRLALTRNAARGIPRNVESLLFPIPFDVVINIEGDTNWPSTSSFFHRTRDKVSFLFLAPVHSGESCPTNESEISTDDLVNFMIYFEPEYNANLTCRDRMERPDAVQFDFHLRLLPDRVAYTDGEDLTQVSQQS